MRVRDFSKRGTGNGTLLSLHWWAPGLILLACLLFSYWPVLERLAGTWINKDDYSHGLLVVPIAAYLTWLKRDQLKDAEVRSDWRGLMLLFLAFGIFVVGELGAEVFTTRVSMLVSIVGLVWLLYGIRVIRILRFPLAFLFLMLPLPGFVYAGLTFPLQLLASTGAVELLQAIGVSVYREGNVIDIGYTQLQVVEACSGLRYILTLFTLAVLFAYFGQRVLWKRLVLILATLPIAVLANVMRIAGTGLVGVYWGEKAAKGFFHFFSGWTVFMLCVGFFVLLNLFLNHLPGGLKSSEPISKPVTKVTSEVNISWLPVLVAIGILLGTPIAIEALGHVPPVPLKERLDKFPLTLQGWKGVTSDMDPGLWEAVGGQDYVIVDYWKKEHPPLNFYAAYYEYQRKAGDFVHSPRLCLPGGGWFIGANRVRELTKPEGGNSHTLKLNELVISKLGTRGIVYFWYQGRGRNFTSEWAAKFWMVWDGIFRRRTDGALVRLIMVLPDGATIQQARSIMDPFALAASRELDKYLP